MTDRSDEYLPELRTEPVTTVTAVDCGGTRP